MLNKETDELKENLYREVQVKIDEFTADFDKEKLEKLLKRSD